MRLIESKTLGTAQALIEFTSIPQDATDLVLWFSLRTDRNLQGDGFYLRFNGSGSSYTLRRLIGDGASPSSDTGGATFMATALTATASTFGNASVYIPNYTSGAFKSYSNDGVSENNATTSYAGIASGLWSNTAAITSIQVGPEGGTNFVAGSMISLYKVTKGSDGIVTTSP